MALHSCRGKLIASTHGRSQYCCQTDYVQARKMEERVAFIQVVRAIAIPAEAISPTMVASS